MDTVVRHPRILDAVITPWGERGTVVLLRAGYVHVDSGDDLRLTVGGDRLRWSPANEAWVVLAAEPPEPVWLADDDDIPHGERHPDGVFGCRSCDDRDERTAERWQRAMAPY